MYEILAEPFNINDKFDKQSIQNSLGRSRITGVHKLE